MRRLALFAVLAAPLVATAQPSDAPTPADNGNPADGTLSADDARIKEIVDREIARVLNERAAKDAADRAATEAAAKDAPAADTKNNPPDLTGASGQFDTRIAFTLTNENLLVKPGETIPSVPGWRFGTPNSLGVLFFDNYDTRFSGYETLTHLVASRTFHKDHFDAETSPGLRINEISEKTIDLSDPGP